jgi:membrane-associated protease RseP (regulator of RpoE activity)
MSINTIKKYALHLGLFLLTLYTTTQVGAGWIGLPQETYRDWIMQGLMFSLPFLGILTIHEFGHYIAARLYKVSVTLPYYIPLPLGIGTLGAFIRIKSVLKTRKIVFDIGIAGPLAGFVAALGLLFYGFTHLPEPDYVLKVHNEYAPYGLEYGKHVYTYDHLKKQDSLSFVRQRGGTASEVGNDPSFLTKVLLALNLIDTESKFPKESYEVMATGNNILFYLFEKYVTPDPRLVPNKYEMFHYPFLFAGFLALFFTALNLIPIGQLDGGHILYALIGAKRHGLIAPFFFAAFVFMGCLGFLKECFDLHPMQSFDDMISFAPLYVFFLYLIFSRVYSTPLNNLLLAVSVFACQFFILLLFPTLEGYEGWWLFAVIIGRFVGIYHPPAMDDTPLDTGRKILGWISLVIFILCFTPQPLVIESIQK